MKKIVTKFLAALFAGTIVWSAISVNVSANASDSWLVALTDEELSAGFSTEYAKEGEPLVVIPKGGTDYTYKWIVGGNVVENKTDTYIPVQSDLEKIIKVQVSSEGKTIEQSIYFSKLPVIYIETKDQAAIESKEVYVSGAMKMQGNERLNQDTTTLYNGKISIKGRGNTTWSLPKKPYKIKLDKSTNIFNMGKSKNWVLLANYSDTSLMRNTLAYNLSGNMGMAHTDTEWVDVILNGKYIGNYQFCEQIQISKGIVDIFDWESAAEDAADAISSAAGFDKNDTGDLEDYMVENLEWVTSKYVTFKGVAYPVENYYQIPDITGGYLMELDEYYDEISKFRTNKGQPIMFKNPEFIKTNGEMLEYVKNYIQAFEDSVYSNDFYGAYKENQLHYSQLFDFDSLVDYWLISELFYNEDFAKKSTYLYKGIDGLIKMGPVWDMDWSSGGEGNTSNTNRWATRSFSANAQANMWYKQLIRDPYFIIKIQERYWEIRDTLLEDIIKEGGEIDSAYQYLKESGSANSLMWPYKNQDFTKGTKILKDWLNARTLWLDKQFVSENAIMSSLGAYAADNRLKLSVSDSKGILPADTVSTTAQACAMAEEGTDIILSVKTDSSEVQKVSVYINGRLNAAVNVSDGQAEAVIKAEALTAAKGQKDVIQVRGIASGSNEVGSNYISILKIENSGTVVEPGDPKFTATAKFTVIDSENGQPVEINTLEGNAAKYININVKASNNSAESKEAVIIAVSYDSTGAMLNSVSNHKIIEAAAAENLEAGILVTEKVAAIKVFVLDGTGYKGIFAGMTHAPLTDPSVLK